MRKFIFAFLFIIAGLSYLFKIDELLVEKFDFFNDLKISYIDKAINLSSSIEKHFDQANSIEKLKIENNKGGIGNCCIFKYEYVDREFKLVEIINNEMQILKISDK